MNYIHTIIIIIIVIINTHTQCSVYFLIYWQNMLYVIFNTQCFKCMEIFWRWWCYSGASCMTSVELSSRRRCRCCCISCLCSIMCSCSSSNMAGLRRADMQKYCRSSCWISAVFLTLAAGLLAQTDTSGVLTVTDANWTRILQDEWMIKLWVQDVWSDHELQDSRVSDQINNAAIRCRFDLPRSATM